MAALLIQARLPQSILEVQGLPEGPCHELHRDPELYKDVIKRREWSHMPTFSLSPPQCGRRRGGYMGGLPRLTMYNLTHRHDEPRRASPFKGTRHAAASLQLFMREHTQKARKFIKGLPRRRCDCPWWSHSQALCWCTRGRAAHPRGKGSLARYAIRTTARPSTRPSRLLSAKVSPGLEVRRGSDDGQYLLKSLIEMMERAPMVACAPPQPLELPLPVG